MNTEEKTHSALAGASAALADAAAHISTAHGAACHGTGALEILVRGLLGQVRDAERKCLNLADIAGREAAAGRGAN
jgi:hypothetical protein